jgi:hypothetical protein
MSNILVMIPSGEVYDHDCVRWYDHGNIQKNIGHYHNIGDAFVYDSSLKLLNYKGLDVLSIRQPKPNEADRYNNDFSFCFLRGSNYIHPHMDWENAIPVLEKIKIPVLAFGIGAQAPSEGPLIVSEATKRVLHLIADRSVSIGVRGAYTADVLWGLGIKNTRIIGCPTLFRNNDPELRIDLPPLDQIKKVGYTLRREVSGAYAQNIDRYLSVQRNAILSLMKRFEIEVMAQGEVEEKKILVGTPEQKAEALASLTAQKWFTGDDDPLKQLYLTRMFYSDVVGDYQNLVRRKDLVLGYRLHGNLMALANKIPSIYFTYDSRTSEFVETFGIPSYDVFSKKEFVLEEYWDMARFERFNRIYHQRYRDMRAFLDENGVSHKMKADAAKIEPRAAAVRKTA